MAREVTQDEFLAHVEALFDGTTMEPATYKYKSEVRLDFGGGPKVSDEAYETFYVEDHNLNSKGDFAVYYNKIGGEGFTFSNARDKAETVSSLRQFFAEQPDAGLRYFIGLKLEPSIWARAPNQYDR